MGYSGESNGFLDGLGFRAFGESLITVFGEMLFTRIYKEAFHVWKPYTFCLS